MRFQFPLEGVLRVRRLLERQARERLEESLMRLHALDHSLAEATQWSQKTAAMSASKKLLPAIELQFVESVLCQTREAIVHCQHQKQVEEQSAARLRTAYLEARCRRETVSTLREHALQNFQSVESRRDQSALDEIYLGKLIYSRNVARQISTPAYPREVP